MISLYWTIGLTEVFRVEGLFSFDPWYHLAVTNEVEARQGMIYGFEYYSGNVKFDYPTSMWILVSSLHQLSGVELITLFKILGLFARTAAALAVYILGVHILSHNGYALIAPGLLLASPYLYFRALITFPENFALVFILLAFYAMLKSLKSHRLTTLLPLVLAAHLYIHYRSALVSFSLLAIVLVYGLSKKSFVPNQVISFSIKLVIFALPVVGLAAYQYYLYPITNIGEQALWAPFAADWRYAPPSWDTYVYRIGILAVILAVVGSATVIRQPSIPGLLLLFWLALMGILTRGAEFQILVPTDRVFAYLILPVTILGALGAKFLVSLVKPRSVKFRAFLAIILAASIVASMVVVLPDIRGWEGISQQELDAVEWLNENIADSTVVAVAGSILLPYYLVVEKRSVDVTRFDYWERVLAGDPDQIWALLNRTYPNSLVYLVVRGDQQLPDSQLTFANERLRIYEFHT
jgi:hypothetical protein